MVAIRTYCLAIYGWIAKGVVARRIVVTEYVRRSKLHTTALALMLTFGSRVLIAQSNSVAPVQSTPRYELPKSLPQYPQSSPSNAVSSDEFERMIGFYPQSAPPQTVQSPQLGLPAQARGSPLPPNSNAGVATPSPFPSSVDSESAPEWLNQFDSARTNGNTIPWWQFDCSKPILINDEKSTCQVELEQLVWHAMQYSPRVKSILIIPQIQQTDIEIARGEFDRRRTISSTFRDNSDPVGNTLTTGGPNRLNEQFWDNSVGLKDRNMIGGKTELLQSFNAHDSNSVFFKPNNQADTKLSLNYTQPLLRGSGRFYNTSSIRIAGIKSKEKFAEANRQLQDHAKEVITTYWELVLQRYLLAQAREGLTRLKAIEKHLIERAGRDLLKTHLSRARSAIKNQEAQMIQARTKILSFQESLRRLVNSPEMALQNCMEIIPLTMPSNELPVTPLEEEGIAALASRGDILSIRETINEAIVQKRLAMSELKPQLDLETSGYIRGLRGENQFSQAFGDQYAEGRPSISAGVTGSLPAGNRSAKATVRSRDLEIAQLKHDYAETLNKAMADIRSAIFNAESTYATTLAAIDATYSSRDEVNGQQVRFDDFFGENQSSSNILNDLLDAEGRLISAENTWATRQIQHMIALMSIKYESGTLMTLNAEQEVNR